MTSSETSLTERDGPLFSIVLPVYSPPISKLRRCLKSVVRQKCQDWEICIVNDSSPDTRVVRLLRSVSKRDRRVLLKEHAKNLGISASTADAVAMSRGRFLVFLDHDDELAPNALEELERVIESDSEVDFIYSDEEIVHNRVSRAILYKPDFSPIRLLSQNYIGHVATIEKDLLVGAGGVREGFEGAQDYDMYLRSSLRATKVAHVRKPLYRWNIHQSSFSNNLKSRDAVWDAGLRALQDHLAVSEISEIKAERLLTQNCFSIWTGKGHTDTVAVLKIPSDLIINGLKLEDGAEPRSVVDLHALIQDLDEQIRESRAKHVVVVADAQEGFSLSGVRLLSQYLHLSKVGIVAPLVIDRHGVVVSSGHFHRGGCIMRAGFGIRHEDHLTMGPLEIPRDVSSVGMEMFALNRDAFLDVDGFSNDVDPRLAVVDLSLKMGLVGKSTVVDPRVVIRVGDGYTEKVACSGDDVFSQRWSRQLHYDPFDWVPQR